jgi:elongation factor Ts
MSVSLDDVKKLRAQTGAGMGDCKKALESSGGDFQEAIVYLRKHNLAAAGKRSDRAANEGRIFIAKTDSRAVVLELSCETDFVAITEDMGRLGNQLAQSLAKTGSSVLLDEETELVKEVAAKLKENLSVRRVISYAIEEGEVVGDYLHGKHNLGVLVKIKTPSAEVANKPEVKELSRDLAMHVAAYAPSFLDREHADPAFIANLEKIAHAQAEELKGKPESVIEKILKGKVDKELAANCLMDQAFVKDESLTVKAHIAAVGKKLGTELSVVEFSYVKVGQE